MRATASGKVRLGAISEWNSSYELYLKYTLARTCDVFGLTSDWSWFPVGYTTHILTEMCSRVGYLGAMPGNTRLLRIT